MNYSPWIKKILLACEPCSLASAIAHLRRKPDLALHKHSASPRDLFVSVAQHDGLRQERRSAASHYFPDAANRSGRNRRVEIQIEIAGQNETIFHQRTHSKKRGIIQALEIDRAMNGV